MILICLGVSYRYPKRYVMDREAVKRATLRKVTEVVTRWLN